MYETVKDLTILHRPQSNILWF